MKIASEATTVVINPNNRKKIERASYLVLEIRSGKLFIGKIPRGFKKLNGNKARERISRIIDFSLFARKPPSTFTPHKK